MKILLTGATGLLGSRIAQNLLQKGHTVFATKRASSSLRLVKNAERIHWMQGELSSKVFLKKCLVNVEVVIHAAAMVSYKKSDQQKLFDTNSELTRLLAEESLKAGVKNFIFVSSVSALGKGSRRSVVDEDTPWDDDEFHTSYGRSKRLAESYLRELGAQGLSYQIIAPSVILGAALPGQSSAQLFGYVLDQKPFFTNGLLNYVYVEDVVKVIQKLLDQQHESQKWIVNGGVTTYKVFFELVAAYLKVKPPYIKVPPKLVLAGAFLENVYSFLLNKPPLLSKETAKMAGSSYQYVGNKVSAKLGITYTSLESSVKNTVQEMREILKK